MYSQQISDCAENTLRIDTMPRPEHVFLAQVAGRALHHKRTPSTESTASLPNYRPLHDCNGNITTSPSHTHIASASWRRFSSNRPDSPPGELKASLLCKDTGKSASYDPPVDEWCVLDAVVPVYVGKPLQKRMMHRREEGSASSSTLSSNQSGAITFKKREVKRVSNSSQLTASIEGSPVGILSAAQRMGLGDVNCEDLPSAFHDSDDED
jgi:hypothetical protein